MIKWDRLIHTFTWWTTGGSCLCAKLLQSCLTLCDFMDYCPPGSSVHGILQPWILEWVAVPSSKGSSWPETEPTSLMSTCSSRQVLYHWHHLGSHRWFSGKESACNVGDSGRRRGFDSWVGKIPWGKKMATHSSILAWKIPIHGVTKQPNTTGWLNKNKNKSII